MTFGALIIGSVPIGGGQETDTETDHPSVLNLHAYTKEKTTAKPYSQRSKVEEP